MNVGLIIGGQQYTGGVYEFETALLGGLRDHAKESGHVFFVLNAPAGFQSEEFMADHLRFSDSGRSAPGLLGRALTKGVRIARNPWRDLTSRLSDSQMPMLDLDAVGDNIDILYYLAPQPIAADIPFILTVYDLQHRLYPEFPEVSVGGRWRSRELMYSTLIPRASALIAITDESKREMAELYQVRPQRIKVLPMVPIVSEPEDTPESSPGDVLERYGIPEGYVFYPAHFWPHKNHVGLLLAVQILREQHGITIPVVFTGSDKGNERYIRRVVEELGMAEQVHFLGFVPDQDMPSLYRQALALAMVSFFGPANIPPLEAFALGCPVINSDFRGAEEHIGDAGLLVDPKSPLSIATAIKSLHEDEALRQSLIERGRSRSGSWTMRDYCQGVLSILDDVAPLRRCWSNTEPYALPAPPRTG